MDDISKFAHFAIVVEGEVAETIAIHPASERTIAALSSNPVIISVTNKQAEDFRSGTVTNPWTYDGEKFVAPAQS